MSPFTGSAARTTRWEHLRVEHADGVATVTLSRPEKLNALTFGATPTCVTSSPNCPGNGRSAPWYWPAKDAASAPAATSTRSSAPPSAWTPPSSWTSTG